MTERFKTIVVGGGQAGLAMGHELAGRGKDFVILDAADHVGDAWRNRWDSLVLFTPRSYSTLPGLPMPGNPRGYPTKDEMADYLASYAVHFRLPVRLSSKVTSLERAQDGFLVRTDQSVLETQTVVIAAGAYQVPAVPSVADLFSPEVRQFTPGSYKNPSGVPEGTVLVVGDGATGRQIALELAATQPAVGATSSPIWRLDAASSGGSIVWACSMPRARAGSAVA